MRFVPPGLIGEDMTPQDPVHVLNGERAMLRSSPEMGSPFQKFLALEDGLDNSLGIVLGHRHSDLKTVARNVR
jgi:hypothetical protein